MIKVRTLAAASAVALTTTLSVAGCAATVPGTPFAEGKSRTGDSAQFDKLLRECEAVPNEKIAETVGGESIDQYFYGAVCMWTVAGPSGAVDVTFGWFETNTLQREKAIAEQIGYAVESTTIAGTSAFVARRPGESATCGVTAAYSGVVTWWVQQLSGAGDPCDAASKLAELALQRNQ